MFDLGSIGMNSLQHLRRLLAYDEGANHEVLSLLQVAAVPLPRSVRWLAHIIAAEELWLDRIEGLSPHVVVWPDSNLEVIHSELQKLSNRWQASLSRLAEEGLISQVEYKNSKGEPWVSTVDDILLHVTMHSAYHRGQIAADFRAAGLQPPYTDYIHAIRRGFVK